MAGPQRLDESLELRIPSWDSRTIKSSWCMIRHKFIRSTSCDPFGKWWNELGQGVILGCIFFGLTPIPFLSYDTLLTSKTPWTPSASICRLIFWVQCSGCSTLVRPTVEDKRQIPPFSGMKLLASQDANAICPKAFKSSTSI